jgi:hypothetical protein
LCEIITFLEFKKAFVKAFLKTLSIFAWVVNVDRASSEIKQAN